VYCPPMHLQASLGPLALPRSVESEWSEVLPISARLLRAWSRYSPRMRAALPTYCGSRFLNDRKMIVRSKTGALFAVEPSDLGTYFSMLNNGLLYPTQVLETCIQHLSGGDVMYDIGANIGFVSIEVAHHFAGGVRVKAFEPQPRLSHAIAISARLNRVDIDVFDLILSEGEGQAEIFVSSNTAHASLKPRNRGAVGVTRPMAALDALIQGQTMAPPSLIKLDVEGSELAVLRGARRTLSEHRPYLLFEADSNMERFGYSKQDLFELIRSSADYTFYDVQSDSQGKFGRVRRVEHAGESLRDDVLAVPPDKPLMWR